MGVDCGVVGVVLGTEYGDSCPHPRPLPEGRGDPCLKGRDTLGTIGGEPSRTRRFKGRFLDLKENQRDFL